MSESMYPGSRLLAFFIVKLFWSGNIYTDSTSDLDTPLQGAGGWKDSTFSPTWAVYISSDLCCSEAPWTFPRLMLILEHETERRAKSGHQWDIWWTRAARTCFLLDQCIDPLSLSSELPENWTDTRETILEGMTFNLRHLGMTLVDQPRGEDLSAAAVKRIVATVRTVTADRQWQKHL